MPHVIVKLWPGKSEHQKRQLVKVITTAVEDILECAEESVSVGFEEVPAGDWAEKVFKPDIQDKAGTLYKKPGYDM